MNDRTIQVFDRDAERFSNVFKRRWRVEIELLSIFARSPRFYRGILSRMHVIPADFGDFDKDAERLICAGLWLAGEPTGPPAGVLGVVATIAKALEATNQWDKTDTRPFVTGGLWNPASLALLLARGPDDETILKRRARQLHRLNLLISTRISRHKEAA